MEVLNRVSDFYDFMLIIESGLLLQGESRIADLVLLVTLVEPVD